MFTCDPLGICIFKWIPKPSKNRSKLCQKNLKTQARRHHHPKILPKTSQNFAKIIQNHYKIEAWRRVEASWQRPGASWGVLGASWDVLDDFVSSWGRLGSSWNVLGASRGRLGTLEGFLSRPGADFTGIKSFFEACHLGNHFSIGFWWIVLYTIKPWNWEFHWILLEKKHFFAFRLL